MDGADCINWVKGDQDYYWQHADQASKAEGLDIAGADLSGSDLGEIDFHGIALSQ